MRETNMIFFSHLALILYLFSEEIPQVPRCGYLYLLVYFPFLF